MHRFSSFNSISSKAFSLILAAGVAACGTTREAQYDTKSAADATTEEKDAATVLIEEGDQLWSQRVEMANLQNALTKWDEAAKLAPTSELYVKLARGNYFLGDAFYAVDGNAEKRDEHYTLGLGFAEKGMKLSAPDYVAAIEAGEKHEAAIQKAPKEAVPAMYWHSTNLSKWAASKGFATKLKYKDDVKATMMRVKALDEDFFYAAAYRYFGAFEAATAGLAGGSLQKSTENFETAVARAPNYLGTKVLWAEYYATKTQDRELFERLLKEVLAADPAADPAIEPENRREQKKAEKLLAKIDDEFS